jgi:hypothetical protein
VSRMVVLLLFALLCYSLAAADQETTRQGFVVRVVPKVTFEQPVVVEQSVPVLRGQPATPSPPVDGNQKTADAAIRLSITGTTGLIIHFEVARRATKASNSGLKVRLAPGGARSWEVRINEDGSAYASSNGHGSATLLLSTDAELDELEIIATVICKD